MKIRHLPHILFICVILLIGTGCGYHNPYTRGNDPGNSSNTLYLDIWPNNTNELGLETRLYQTLIAWFTKSRRISVVRDKEKADLILSGKIRSINLPGLSYGRFDRAVEAHAVLIVEYSMARGNGTPLFHTPGRTFKEAFTIANDPSATNDNKERALTEICEDLAEDIYLKTLTRL